MLRRHKLLILWAGLPLLLGFLACWVLSAVPRTLAAGACADSPGRAAGSTADTAVSIANPQILQQDSPLILSDAFWDGQRYTYLVFAAQEPRVEGGCQVAIMDHGPVDRIQGSGAGRAYEVTSTLPVQQITAGSLTQRVFTIHDGRIFWYGRWWDNDAKAQTIPQGYSTAYAIGRTEGFGTSTWAVRLDDTSFWFRDGTAVHVFRMPITAGQSHAIQVQYVSGKYGVQFSFWGYSR